MQESGNPAGQYSYDSGEIAARHALALAFIASLLWHIFWLSSVKIFVSSPVVEKSAGSAISFVGSILEEGPVLSVKPSGGTAADTDIRRLQDLAVSAEEGGPSGNEKLANASNVDILNELNAKFSADTEVDVKEIPEKPFDKVMVSGKTYPSEIEGPARFREVIYKPELPAYLRWDEGLGVDLDRLGNTFSIELKFWVSAEGKVESVERISSSGHPAVDLVGIRYLKGWQFAPLKSEGPKESQGPERSEGQWGTVKLNFTLNKAETK